MNRCTHVSRLVEYVDQSGIRDLMSQKVVSTTLNYSCGVPALKTTMWYQRKSTITGQTSIRWLNCVWEANEHNFVAMINNEVKVCTVTSACLSCHVTRARGDCLAVKYINSWDILCSALACAYLTSIAGHTVSKAFITPHI
jgi:hypothetical protein